MRIGFACKFSEIDNGAVVPVSSLNATCTTQAWLRRQTRAVAEQRLWDITKHNIESIRQLVARVATLPAPLRMVRLTSDVLPAYTTADWGYFFKQGDVIRYMEAQFARVGELARTNDVRLSMHPGQFTVLASDNPGIVDNSIAEFEYHTDMARMMGYGKSFQDFKINIHISGKRGVEGMRESYQRLSPEARNMITVENDENSWGLDDCIDLSDLMPVVLDVHHYWCREGEYIQPDDWRIQHVIDSWRGVRPTMHYSVSREDVLVGHAVDVAPDMPQLKQAGHTKQKLRAHSDAYWNRAANDYVRPFWDRFDIMCESKHKNIASFALYKYFSNK